MKVSPSLTAVAAVLATSFAFNVAVAQTTNKKATTTDKMTAPADNSVSYSDRARVTAWSSDKVILAQALKVDASKADYIKILADNGYTITAINKDQPDYVEYEVVKGSHSYEVQIDLDKKTKLGTKVDVDSNLWRADATKAALRSGKAVMATKPLANAYRYSDRTYRKSWTNEKEKLEKSLPLGQDVAFYTNELKKRGYQITSTNDQDKDYVEMEVVKGRDSYEVQIDLDDAYKAKKVDVASNMWQSDATEKALAKAKR